MKKILLSAHCKTPEQKHIALALLEIVLSKGYHIDIAANFALDIQQKNIKIISSGNLQTKNYDVIFSYNLKGYQNVKRLAKTKKIPVIYVVRQNDCVEEYLFDVSLIYKFLIINDGNELSYQLYPKECSIHIPYPFSLPQQNRVTTNTSVNILVSTDDKTLLKTIPVYNNYAKYNFTIVTEIPSIIKKTVNENCTVVSIARTNIVDLIKNTALVVGNGTTILTGISYRKPSIVVGKCGFGRRVTPENMEQHFHSLFKGRLGAQGEEIIPFHLLAYEIDSCMNAIC